MTHTQMVELAFCNNLPQSNKSDLLVHDKCAVENNPGRPFYWLIYDCGTHLVWADNKDGLKRTLGMIADCFTKGRTPDEKGRLPYKWYYCDGELLHARLQVEVLDAVDMKG